MNTDTERIQQNEKMSQFVKGYVSRYGTDIDFEEVLQRYERNLPADEYGYIEQSEALRGIFNKEISARKKAAEQKRQEDFNNSMRKAMNERLEENRQQKCSSSLLDGFSHKETNTAIMG